MRSACEDWERSVLENTSGTMDDSLIPRGVENLITLLQTTFDHLVRVGDNRSNNLCCSSHGHRQIRRLDQSSSQNHFREPNLLVLCIDSSCAIHEVLIKSLHPFV